MPYVKQGSDEAAEVVHTVRRAVREANEEVRSGTPKLRLKVVAAERAQRTDLEGAVLVGGFGMTPPAGVPWLFPADPYAHGRNVLAAELSPRGAGAVLGSDLRARGVRGPVGVVVAAGPDRSFAAGLGSKVRTMTVRAGGQSLCHQQILALRRDGAIALAVAGPPELQARCIAAARLQSWAPAGGFLLPPSAAYAGLERLPAVRGARSVLAFGPSRTSSLGAWLHPRYYRTLVSYAAARLAVDAIRAGALDPGEIRESGWAGRLFSLEHQGTAGAELVVATAGGWTTARAQGSGSGSPWPSGPPIPGAPPAATGCTDQVAAASPGAPGFSVPGAGEDDGGGEPPGCPIDLGS